MFPQATGTLLRFQKMPMVAGLCVVGQPGQPFHRVLSDHSLTAESQLPLSPSSQFMYEPDTFFDCTPFQSAPEPVEDQGLTSFYTDAGVISPSVEGLTLDASDMDLMTYFGGCRSDSSDSLVTGNDSEALGGKYMSDAMKLTDTGPTLTQLNSDDLEVTLFDEFDISTTLCPDLSEIDCAKLVPEPVYSKQVPCPPVVSVALVSTARSATCTTTLTSAVPPMASQFDGNFYRWPQPINGENVGNESSTLRQLFVGTVPTGFNTATTNTAYKYDFTALRPTYPPPTAALNIQSGPSQSSSSGAAVKRALSPQPMNTAVSAVSSASTTQPNLDSNWEAIESFLQSEDEKMSSASKDAQLSHVAKKIKTEVPVGSYECREEMTAGNSDSVDSCDESDDSDNCDNESTSDAYNSLLTDFVMTGRKEKTYFWQYNTQSKGPKGKRLCKVVDEGDPYVLHDFEDPVFDQEVQAAASPRYRHSGKARRGDGNDITPNAGKLFSTGKELKKLVRLINDMSLPTELPSAVRARTLRKKKKVPTATLR